MKHKKADVKDVIRRLENFIIVLKKSRKKKMVAADFFGLFIDTTF